MALPSQVCEHKISRYFEEQSEHGSDEECDDHPHDEQDTYFSDEDDNKQDHEKLIIAFRDLEID